VTESRAWVSDARQLEALIQERKASMRVTQKVKEILYWYEGDDPGVKANLARILSTGKLGGTGRIMAATPSSG
jgi:hypothetical protein